MTPSTASVRPRSRLIVIAIAVFAYATCLVVAALLVARTIATGDTTWVGPFAMIVAVALATAVPLLLFSVANSRAARTRSAHAAEGEQRRAAATDRFVTAFADDLRAPLTSIYGFSDYLVETGITDPLEAIEMLRFVSRDAGDLTRRVENLAVGARIDAGVFRLVRERVPVIEELELLVEPLRRAGIPVSVEPKSVVVWADRRAVRLMLWNITANAHVFGGVRMRVGLETKGDRGIITISDDGPGMLAEHEQLFREPPAGGLLSGGPGLGIPISATLARFMDGAVTHVRALGWTNIVVDLPLATRTITGAGSHEEEDVPTGDLPVLTFPVPAKHVAPHPQRAQASPDGLLVRFD